MESYSVKAVLSATDNMSGVFQKAASSAGSFRQKMGSSLQAVGKTSTVLGLAVGAMTGKAIKSYGDFQESINKAAVIAGSSNKKLGSNMKGLEKVALSLGKTLPISAEDAGNAMVEMARNGASIKDLKKEFPSIAKAAAVSGADLSATATTVQQAMNIWGGGAKNAAKDSATLAIVANKSNAEVGDMQQVFANVGTTAKNMGYSLKDVAIAAGVMTNAGIPAAQASMDLNHAFSQMVKPSKTAQGEMKKLGLSYTNAQGEMKPLKTVIKDVANATKGMSGAQKTAALNMLFGSAGAKAMAPLLDSVGDKAKKSGKGWDSFSSSIDKGAGSAKKANKYLNENSQNMTKNVGQSLSQMVDAFDALVKTSIGSIAPQIRAVADALGDFATWLNNSNTPLASFVQRLIALSPIIAGVLVVIGVLATALSKIGTALTAVSSLFGVFRTAITLTVGVVRTLFTVLAANPFVALIAGVVAAVAALVYFFTQTKTGQAIWASFTAWLVNAWNVIKATAITVWTAIGTFFTTVWSGIVSVATTVWTTIATFLSTVWTGILTVATTIWSPIKAFFTTIWSGVSSVTISVWTTISTFLSGIWNGIKTIASGVWQGIKAVIAAVVLVIYSVVTGKFSLLKQTVVALWNALKSAAGTVWNGIKQVISAAVNAVKSVVTSVWNGIKSVTSSVWNGIKSVTSSVWNGIKSVISSVVKAISSAVKSAWNTLKSATSSTFNAIKSVGTAAFNRLKSSVISAAHAMVSRALSAWRSMVSGVRSVVSGIRSAFNVLRNINLVGIGRNIIQGLINGVRSGASALVGTLRNMARNAVRAAKSVLKIHSPSKVFYGIGGYVGQGFVNGIDSMQKQVQRVAGGMGNMASDALNGNVQALNSSLRNGTITNDITGQLSVQQQPAYVSLDLGGSNYTAFVNDISHKQGQTANLKRNYRI